MAVAYVYDGLCLGIDLPDSASSRICQSYEVLAGLALHLAERMQHPVVHFVACLHPFYIHSVVLEKFKSFFSVL